MRIFLVVVAIVTVLLGSIGYFTYKTLKNRDISLNGQELAFSPVYSVMRGENLNLYYNLLQDTSVSLYRLGEGKEKIQSFILPKGVTENLIFNFRSGINADHKYDLNTQELKTGYYFLQGKTSQGSDFVVPFVVADAECNGVNVVASTNTWAAYNDYVRSNYVDYRPFLYKLEAKVEMALRRLFGIDRQDHYVQVPLPWMRPTSFANRLAQVDKGDNAEGSHLIQLEWQLISLLEQEKVPYCVLDDRIFATERYFEKNKSIIFNGHSEYWSKTMINQLDHLILQEKKILFSGGNNIYREVEFNKNDLRVITQKIEENITAPRIGAYYDDRGYGTFAPMKILENNHWIFDGVSQSIIGTSSTYSLQAAEGGISGHETDKISLSSEGFSVLARGQNANATGGADLVYRDNGEGWIANFASLSFVGGYFADPATKQVLKNILGNMQR